MERGLSERFHDRVSPVKRHMDHMIGIGAAPGLVSPQLNTMTSDVIKVRIIRCCIHALLSLPMQNVIRHDTVMRSLLLLSSFHLNGHTVGFHSQI